MVYPWPTTQGYLPQLRQVSFEIRVRFLRDVFSVISDLALPGNRPRLSANHKRPLQDLVWKLYLRRDNRLVYSNREFGGVWTFHFLSRTVRDDSSYITQALIGISGQHNGVIRNDIERRPKIAPV